MIGIALAIEAASSAASPAKGPLSVTLDVAATLSAILWPLVALLLLLAVRDRIPDLLRDLAGRLTKVDFAGLKLELAKATSMAPQYEGPIRGLDLRHTATAVQVSDSTAATFIAQIQDPAPADYAIVDLGGGDQWLTSRLYIMAIVLGRMKGLKAFVFVMRSSPARRYLGWAAPDRVRWALARAYPWLETAYARAYAAVVGDPNTNTIVATRAGRLGRTFNPQDPGPSIDLIRGFLYGIQSPAMASPIAGLAAPAAKHPDAKDWTIIDPGTNAQEHALWLTGALLEELLGEDLEHSHVPADLLERASDAERARHFLAKRGRFVAVTLEDRRFGYLVDRSVLLEQLAEGVRSEIANRAERPSDTKASAHS